MAQPQDQDFGIPAAKPSRDGEWLLRKAADTKHRTSEGRPGEACPWPWVEGSASGEPRVGRHRDEEGVHRLPAAPRVRGGGQRQSRPGERQLGVYMMQRYEVQILNSAPRGPIPPSAARSTGAALITPWPCRPGPGRATTSTSRLPDGKAPGRRPDARVTVFHNGTRVIATTFRCRAPPPPESPRPRAAALRLQDHGNGLRFRNIWIAEKKRSK